MAIHVINLDRDEARLRTFRDTNAHLGAFVRFSAIDGRTADRDALRQAGIITPDLTYNDGQLGCALSHLALWRRAAERHEPVTVLEDDAILAPNFAAAHDATLRALSADWDIILWGWNFDRPVWAEIPEGVAPAVLTFDQDALRANMMAYRQTEAAHAPIRLRHAFGTIAYSVSPAGAARLLDHCLPLQRKFIRFEGLEIGIPNRGIDCLMNLAYPRVNAYACLPPLAVTANRHDMSHTHRTE